MDQSEAASYIHHRNVKRIYRPSWRKGDWLGYGSPGFARYNKYGDMLGVGDYYDAEATDYVVEFKDGTKLTRWVDPPHSDLTLAQAIEHVQAWGQGCVWREPRAGGGFVQVWRHVPRYYPSDGSVTAGSGVPVDEALTPGEQEAKVWYIGPDPWD